MCLCTRKYGCVQRNLLEKQKIQNTKMNVHTRTHVSLAQADEGNLLCENDVGSVSRADQDHLPLW